MLQLSYSAARNSTTRIAAKPKMNGSAPSLRCCWKSVPVHSKPNPGGSVCRATCSIAAAACPEL